MRRKILGRKIRRVIVLFDLRFIGLKIVDKIARANPVTLTACIDYFSRKSSSSIHLIFIIELSLTNFSFRNAEDRFITLGYLAQAYCDSGDYEMMLHYALQVVI